MAGTRYQTKSESRAFTTTNTDLAAEASRRGDTVTAVTETGGA